MNKTGWPGLGLCAALTLGSGLAQAGPMTFGQAFVASIASNASFTTTFDASSSGSTFLQVDVGTVDEGFALAINGTTVFDVPAFDVNDPGHPVGVTPGLQTPWNWDGQHARVRAKVSATSLLLEGLVLQSDATYTTLTLLSAFTLPTFLDGSNTVTLTSRNQFGPGGMTNVTFSGTVPEPATWSLVAMMLVGMVSAGVKRARS